MQTTSGNSVFVYNDVKCSVEKNYTFDESSLIKNEEIMRALQRDNNRAKVYLTHNNQVVWKKEGNVKPEDHVKNIIGYDLK